MPRFKCTNTECDNEELIPHVRFKWDEKQSKLTSDHDTCPICGSTRDVVKEYDGASNLWFKAENAKNYNNKSVKQYDYDHNHDK